MANIKFYIKDLFNKFGFLEKLNKLSENGKGTVTINQKGSKKGEFTLNQTGNTTINLDDNNTTYSTATSSTLGLVKIGYQENGKNYPIKLSNGQMFVTVPWTDTNTTYSVFTGATSTTAGKPGLVPAPSAGKNNCFLKGDGTWVEAYNLSKDIKLTGASGDTTQYAVNNWIQLCKVGTLSLGQFYINVHLGTLLTTSFRMDIIKEGSNIHPFINVWSSNDDFCPIGLDIAVVANNLIYIRATIEQKSPYKYDSMKDVYIEIKQYLNKGITFTQPLTQTSGLSSIQYIYSMPDAKNQLFTENIQTNSISISEGDPTQVLKANGLPTTGGGVGSFLVRDTSGVRWIYPSVFRDIFTRTLKMKTRSGLYDSINALMDIDSNNNGDVYVNIHIPSIACSQYSNVSGLISKTAFLSYSDTSSSYTEGEDSMLVYVVSGAVDGTGNTFLQIKGYGEFPDTTFIESLVDHGVDIYLYWES